MTADNELESLLGRLHALSTKEIKVDTTLSKKEQEQAPREHPEVNQEEANSAKNRLIKWMYRATGAVALAGILAISTFGTLRYIEVSREKRFSQYSQDINQAETVKNAESKKTIEEVYQKLLEEDHPLFNSLKEKTNILYSQTKLEEIVELTGNGNFAEAEQISSTVLEGLKENPSQEVQNELTKIKEYTSNKLEPLLKRLAKAEAVFTSCKNRHSSINADLRIKDEERLRKIKEELIPLSSEYVSLKQDTDKLASLASEISASIEACGAMKSKLANADKSLVLHKKAYLNLPKPDVDSSPFVNLSNSLKDLLKTYQSVKEEDRMMTVQALISEMDTSIKICQENRRNKISEANTLLEGYQKKYLAIEITPKHKPGLIELKTNLGKLAETYSYLKIDAGPVRDLTAKVDKAIDVCKSLESLLTKADESFSNYQKAVKLLEADIDPSEFEKLVKGSQVLAETYKLVKEEKKTNSVQDLIADLTNSINTCKRNKQKLDEYSNKFGEIKKSIPEKNDLEISLQIKELAVNLEKEVFPSANSLLKEVKEYSYQKIELIPSKITQKEVMTGFIEKIWVEPVYESTGFLGWGEKKLVKEGYYKKGKSMPSIYDSEVIPPRNQLTQITSYSQKISIRELPAKPEEIKYSPLEKAIMARKEVQAEFEFDSKQSSKAKAIDLSSTMPDKKYEVCFYEYEGKFNILIREYKVETSPDKRKIEDLVKIGLAVSTSDKADLGKGFSVKEKGFSFESKPINTKPIYSQENKYLILVPANNTLQSLNPFVNSLRNSIEVEDGTVHYKTKLTDGELRLDLQVHSWGTNDKEMVTAKFGSTKLSYYKYLKLGGKARVSFQPNEIKD